MHSATSPPVGEPACPVGDAELIAHNLGLRAALSARDAFLAVAAHELRNPLTPILGHLELLQAAVRGGRLSVDQIGEKLDRLAALIDHYGRRAETLLDVSRLTTGTLQLNPEDCDVAAMLRRLAVLLPLSTGRAGTTIEVQAPDSLVGWWDRGAVEQIIDNLLSNALKYGARRGVELGASAQPDDTVTVVIRDYGEGLSAENRARISAGFDDAVGVNHRRSGFGAGLWVAGQLAAAMGGRIAVDDPPGGGTRVCVSLPRRAGR